MQRPTIETPPPPGFPSRPQYSDQKDDDDDQASPYHNSPYIPVMMHSNDGYRSHDPRSANIASLSATFDNIDTEADYRKERDRLLAILDQGGDVQ